jgi:hypothetical protein
MIKPTRRMCARALIESDFWPEDFECDPGLCSILISLFYYIRTLHHAPCSHDASYLYKVAAIIEEVGVLRRSTWSIGLTDSKFPSDVITRPNIRITLITQYRQHIRSQSLLWILSSLESRPIVILYRNTPSAIMLLFLVNGRLSLSLISGSPPCLRFAVGGKEEKLG